MSTRAHRRRHRLGRFSDRGYLLQARISQRRHADIWIDGAKRIVLGRGRGRGGKGVEQARLADVGQADYPALQGHQSSSPAPAARLCSCSIAAFMSPAAIAGQASIARSIAASTSSRSSAAGALST